MANLLHYTGENYSLAPRWNEVSSARGVLLQLC